MRVNLDGWGEVNEITGDEKKVVQVLLRLSYHRKVVDIYTRDYCVWGVNCYKESVTKFVRFEHNYAVISPVCREHYQGYLSHGGWSEF